MENKDYIITSDTDSLFIHVKDLLEHRFPDIDLTDKKIVIPLVLEIAQELQQIANKHINETVSNFNITDNKHYFELKQEVVLERGYFSMKRRYAMYIVNKEGVDVEELVIMGLNIMKSDMPKHYKKFGEGLIQEIMFGKPQKEIDKKILDFKKEIDISSYQVIAKPTGVKKIGEYIKRPAGAGEIFSDLELRCPINSRSAIVYNDLLKFKGLDKKYPGIMSGDKMKYVSLKPNPFKLDVIGFTGSNDPEFIVDFIEQYVDRDGIFNSVLLNKLTSIYKDIGWEFVNLNPKVSRFFKF